MSDSLPNHKLSANWLISKMRPIDELETVPVILRDITVDGELGTGMVVEIEEVEYVIHTTGHEAEDLDYLLSGFAAHAHLPNTYQVLTSAMSMAGFRLVEYCIEAAEGDVFHARLLWQDSDGKFFSCVMGAGEGGVVALYARAPMKIIRSVVPRLTRLDEWPYEDEIESEM